MKGSLNAFSFLQHWSYTVNTIYKIQNIAIFSFGYELGASSMTGGTQIGTTPFIPLCDVYIPCIVAPTATSPTYPAMICFRTNGNIHYIGDHVIKFREYIFCNGAYPCQ